MKPADLLIINANLLTLAGANRPRGGEEMKELCLIEDGALAVRGDRVLAAGTTVEIQRSYPEAGEIIDAHGNLVMPGFVDCHTHTVFAGKRSGEMEQRLKGVTYLEILKSGGGIHSTVKATRGATPEELYHLGFDRLDRMVEHGTTTVEIKSGYGLDEKAEEKMLDVINRLSREHPMDIVATYLGAHTIPRDIDRSEYMKWLGGDSLKRFRGKAEFFDIFCEDGAFTAEETKLLLKAAKKTGFGLKVHAGQFNDLGATKDAALLGAISADHLERISDEQLSLMADKGTIGVLMPGVPFFLQSDVYPDAGRFRKAGTPFALATDFNPGSCPSYSMQMMITLGAFFCGMEISEAITAATINAAWAIGRGNEVGSLEAGKKADVVILDITTPEEIAYYFGANLVQLTMKEGKVLYQRPELRTTN